MESRKASGLILSINGSDFQFSDGAEKMFSGDITPHSFLRFQYALDEYNFPDIVARIIGVEESELSRVHEIVDETGVVLPEFRQGTFTTGGYSRVHQSFYANVNPGTASPTELGTEFLDRYQAFLRHFRDCFVSFDFFFQTIPTIRVQKPGQAAVKPHRDHENPGSPHRMCPQAVNLFVPFTEARGTGAIQVETEDGSGQFLSLDASPGQGIVWDGNHILHKNEPNTSGGTRVSMDFRIIPCDQFDPTYASEHFSVNLGTPFTVGEEGYFSELD